MLKVGAVLLLAVLLPGCRNRPPEVPEFEGPSIGYVDTAYTFGCYPYDSDNDDVAIRYDWGDGDTSAWSGWVECGFVWGAEPELIEMTHSWATPGTFPTRAQATDRHGLTSDWSETCSVAILVESGARWWSRADGAASWTTVDDSDRTEHEGPRGEHPDTPCGFHHDNRNVGWVGGQR